MTDTNPHRLPRTVVPLRYELRIEPDLDDATFRGEQSVEVEVTEPVDEIVLNAIELEIDEAWLEQRQGPRVTVDVQLDEAAERATLVLPHRIDKGEWFVHLRFRGVLNDKLHGFYRSSYHDDDGTEHVIATTQFEATDARRAFPCWDEPDFKAVFAVTLVVAEDLLAVSNAQELQREPLTEGRVAVHFVDTMPMSTYLVAFVVGRLEATDAVDVDGVPLRVVHRPGRAELTPFALEVGAFALRFFADYYDIVYPGGKLDLVAIPDFAFGAMENLGCVTFREVLVLVDPERATQSELQAVVDVIAHELAHMWFGDLVTMKWWNGIWLNEAFATFMEMLCTDAFRPDWDRWVSFGLSRAAAFDVDALHTTRPIEFEVVSPEDAEGMFDILTYEKGAAVVRMLEQYLGAEQFRDGIRTYLRANQFGNTDTTDLWDALEAATGEPVRRVMDSWIFQGGFPVIDVELVQDGGDVRLAQRRFLYDGDDDTAWTVPLILSQGAQGEVEFERLLLEPGGADVALWEQIDWVLVNTEGTGFYRARYAPDLLRALTAHAQAELSAIERFVVVDDAWASVLAGDTEAGSFLELADAFTDETDLSVWQRLVGGLGALDRLVEGDDRTALQGRIRALLSPTRDRLGDEPSDGESDRTRQLRATVLEALGVLGHDVAAVERARAIHALTTISDDATPPVDPALQAASVAVLAAVGGEPEYDAFTARFEAASTPQEELRYLSALADFAEPALLARTLDMSITDRVRTQNAPYLLRRALHNRELGEQAWGFVKDRWDAINERFPSNSIARMLEGVRSLSRPATAADVVAFFDGHPVPQGEKTLAQHLERLRVNVALREREAERLPDALR